MLPKTAEYALRAVVWLGRVEGCQSADALAASIQVPRRYLHTVLQQLARAELVQSQSGPGGGYTLTKEIEEISILDVIKAVSPLERIDRCPLGLRSHTKLCPLHKALDDAYAATEKAFASVTIAELLDSTQELIPMVELMK